MGIFSYITSKDKLSRPAYKMLHYDGGSNQKSFAGGIFTLIVKLLVFYIVITEFVRLVTNSSP